MRPSLVTVYSNPAVMVKTGPGGKLRMTPLLIDPVPSLYIKLEVGQSFSALISWTWFGLRKDISRSHRV